MPAPDPASLPLRDIHLPEAVSWWPPAPGWWLLPLLAALLALLALICFRRRRGAARRAAVGRARRELARIRHEFDQRHDPGGLARALSALLRRLAMSLYSRRDTAALTGEAWLAFLDQAIEGHEFTRGRGRSLIEAPYRPHPEFDHAALLQLVSDWIEQAAANREGGHAAI